MVDLRTLVSATLVLACIGCSGPGPTAGTDVGNGATVDLDLQGYEAAAPAGGSSTPSSNKSLDLSSGAVIDHVWIAVEKVRFEPGNVCVDETGEEVEEEGMDVDFEGPLVADLVGGGSLGGGPRLALSGTSFCRLRLDLHSVSLAASPGGTPSALDGLSIRVEGRRVDGVPFVVESDASSSFELRSGGQAFSIMGDDNPLLLGFELGSWVAALDLGSLTDAAIEVSDEVNSDRLEAFESAVEASAKLFRDADGNGALSPAEATPANAIVE